MDVKIVILSVLGIVLLMVFNLKKSKMMQLDTYKKQLELEPRKGEAPTTGGIVPHQQIDQNSPKDIMDALSEYLFSLPYVKQQPARGSLPTALGAYIDPSVSINPMAMSREFTHIHNEPGPGSMHVMLPKADADEIIEKGWGVPHPHSRFYVPRGYTVMLTYAPRNKEDLNQIKKIVHRAYEFALDVN